MTRFAVLHVKAVAVTDQARVLVLDVLGAVAAFVGVIPGRWIGGAESVRKLLGWATPR